MEIIKHERETQKGNNSGSVAKISDEHIEKLKEYIFELETILLDEGITVNTKEGINTAWGELQKKQKLERKQQSDAKREAEKSEAPQQVEKPKAPKSESWAENTFDMQELEKIATIRQQKAENNDIREMDISDDDSEEGGGVVQPQEEIDLKEKIKENKQQTENLIPEIDEILSRIKNLIQKLPDKGKAIRTNNELNYNSEILGKYEAPEVTEENKVKGHTLDIQRVIRIVEEDVSSLHTKVQQLEEKVSGLKKDIGSISKQVGDIEQITNLALQENVERTDALVIVANQILELAKEIEGSLTKEEKNLELLELKNEINTEYIKLFTKQQADGPVQIIAEKTHRENIRDKILLIEEKDRILLDLIERNKAGLEGLEGLKMKDWRAGGSSIDNLIENAFSDDLINMAFNQDNM